MAQHDDHDQYAEVFEAGHSGKEHTVHQRMRANSTIMQLKKILGTATFPHLAGAIEPRDREDITC